MIWADRVQSTVPAVTLCSSPEATVRNTAGSVRLRSDAGRKRNTREKCAVLWNIRTSGARINTDFFRADLVPDDNYILKPQIRGSNGLQRELLQLLRFVMKSGKLKRLLSLKTTLYSNIEN